MGFDNNKTICPFPVACMIMLGLFTSNLFLSITLLVGAFKVSTHGRFVMWQSASIDCSFSHCALILDKHMIEISETCLKEQHRLIRKWQNFWNVAVNWITVTLRSVLLFSTKNAICWCLFFQRKRSLLMPWLIWTAFRVIFCLLTVMSACGKASDMVGFGIFIAYATFSKLMR